MSRNLSEQLDALHAKLLAIGTELICIKRNNMKDTNTAVKRSKIG